MAPDEKKGCLGCDLTCATPPSAERNDGCLGLFTQVEGVNRVYLSLFAWSGGSGSSRAI